MRTKFSNVFSVLTIASLLVAGTVAGCSDDDPEVQPIADAGGGSSGTADSSTPANDVSARLSVTYNGDKKGPVLVSVWPTAMGPQAGGFPAGSGSNETATWPGTNAVEVRNVSPGHYFVFAYVMVGGDHRQGPAPGDPIHTASAEIDVVAGQTASAALTLDIELPGGPPETDGGTDAGDAGGDAGDTDSGI